MNHGLSNDFIYAVSKIEVEFTKGLEVTTIEGTGFFISKDENIVFITNRHVLQPSWSNPKFSDFKLKNIKIEKHDYNPIKRSVDVCVLQLGPCRIYYANNNKDDIACLINMTTVGDDFYANFISFSLLATMDDFDNKLSVCDQVAMIGFPLVYDHKNNVPILRSGVISSDPRLDYSYDKEDHGHILAYELFGTPGSSGSPVFATQKGYRLGENLKAPSNFFRPVLIVGINSGYVSLGNLHQQMSYMVKSTEIINLIDYAIESERTRN